MSTGSGGGQGIAIMQWRGFCFRRVDIFRYFRVHRQPDMLRKASCECAGYMICFEREVAAFFEASNPTQVK